MPPNQPGSAYRRYTQGREQCPEDLRLPFGVPATLRAVGRTYIRRLWPLLVAITVPLAPAILLCALFMALPGYAVVDGAPTYLGTPAAWQLTAWGLTAAVALVGTALSLGSASVLGSAALMGRDVPVAAAWRIALRRLPVLLTWEAVTAVLVVAALWVVLVRSQESEMALPVLVLLLLPPFSLLMAVWSVVLSAALLEGRGPLEACRRGWEMGIECRTTHMVLVLIFTVVSVAAVVGAELAAGRIAESGADQLLSLAARGAVLTLSAPLMLLLLCTPGVHSSPVSPWDIDLVRVGEHLPAAGATVWPRPRPRVTVPLTALAVVLPVVAVPLAPILSPSLTPQTVSGPVSANNYRAQQMAVSDGTVLLTRSGQNPLTVCDPECEPVEDALDEGLVDAVATVGDGYVATVWKRDPGAEGEPWEEEPPLDGGLRLIQCSGPDEDDCHDSGEVRVFPDLDFQSSVAPLNEGVVIASYVSSLAMVENEEDLEDPVGLRADVCGDTECSDPHEVDLSDEIGRDDPFLGTLGLDVAASPDGGFAVTVLEHRTGVLTLTHCADPACAAPVTTELSEQNIFHSLDGHPESGRFGAHVEYRPDGTPVVAHRDTRLGEAHLVDCHDAACTDSTVRVLAEPSWARNPPGLAIDSQGLPQVATVDMDTRQLTLISCLDSGCSDHTSVPLAGFDSRPGVTLLELDAQDRPHLLWGRSVEERAWEFEHDPGGEYLRCTRPRCGVPAQEP